MRKGLPSITMNPDRTGPGYYKIAMQRESPYRRRIAQRVLNEQVKA